MEQLNQVEHVNQVNQVNSVNRVNQLNRMNQVSQMNQVNKVNQEEKGEEEEKEEKEEEEKKKLLRMDRWQGDINCGASSQDDFILNYFLANFPKFPQISPQILLFLPAWLAGWNN